MRLIIVSLLLLATPAICSAETYKWIDEKGNIGYVDDLGKVPKKYRDSAVITEKIEQAVEVVEKKEPEKPQRKGVESKRDGVDDKTKDKDKQPLFDGKSGETWKQDFARQKNEVKSLEEQLAGIKERIAEGNKISRSDFLSLQSTQRDLDVRIAKAKKKLDALDAAADRAELPAEFR
jgi:hypothetical protein